VSRASAKAAFQMTLACWAGVMTGRADANDASCWHRSRADPSRYELILRPASETVALADLAVLRSFESILTQAGVSGCDAHTATGACLATYKAADSNDNPLKKARLLLELGKQDNGGNLFAYVVPNAPLQVPETASAQRTAPNNPLDESELMDLGAKSAWSKVPPTSSIVTAVIDSGVDLVHPALHDNLLSGKDFSCGSVNCVEEPQDTLGHGTHMAGIIAGNDAASGFRGVAWNTHVMPLKIFADTDSTDFQGGEAIRWAVDHRADVINASWISPCPLPHVLHEVLHAEDKHVLFVAAAGNGGGDIEQVGQAVYPAIYGASNTVVVMGHLPGGQFMSSSKWGRHTVNLAAPGTGLTTERCATGNCFAREYGTSVSAAFVSGAAALLKSAHPDWPAQWLKTQLMESAVADPSLKHKSKTGARLMLDRALNGPLQVRIPSRGTTWHRSTPATVKWSNDYRSSLCTAVTISVRTDSSNEISLATAIINCGEAVVPLDAVLPSTQAVLKVTCIPAGFSAHSAEFTISQ
jgi:hypothetical protein